MHYAQNIYKKLMKIINYSGLTIYYNEFLYIKSICHLTMVLRFQTIRYANNSIELS